MKIINFLEVYKKQCQKKGYKQHLFRSILLHLKLEFFKITSMYLKLEMTKKLSTDGLADGGLAYEVFCRVEMDKCQAQ